MMIESVAARWLFTAVFAAAALGAALPREPGGPERRADRVAAVFCMVMGAAFDRHDLAARAGRRSMGAASRVRLRRALVRAGQPGQLWSVPAAWPDQPASFAEGGALIWMLTAVHGAAGMRPPGHGHGAMAAMPGAAMPVPVLAVSGLVAAYCAAASIPWLVRAIGPGLRVKDPAAVGHAVMSAGMAAMLIAML